jgi:vWA-MoxR associated protein C-terminal domain
VSGIISVTVDPSKLQSILDRLEAGNPLKSEDLEILVAGLATRQVIMATGKSAIALGTSADGATISSGDRNIIIPKEIAEAIQEKIGGNIDLHSGDRHITINNTFLSIHADSVKKNNWLQQQINLILKDVDPKIIQQAYKQSLPLDSHLWERSNNDLIFNDLQLPLLIKNLIENDLVPQNKKDELNKISPQSNRSTSAKSVENNALDSYLSIVIRSVQSSDKLFSIDAWSIADSTSVDSSQQPHPLDIDSIGKGEYCALDDMPKVLNDFLKSALEHLDGKIYNLTIEIFLPMKLLCMDIDRWLVSDLDDEIPIGTRYRTIVRSSDRLNRRYLTQRWSQWNLNWDRVKTCGHLKPNCDDFETIDHFVDRDWQESIDNLYQEKLGLKLTCGLEAEHKQDLFNAIHLAATPIAIWVRCNLPNLDLATEIDDLITGNTLFGLSVAVLRKRQQARSDQHLGRHLAMLWEDPAQLKRLNLLAPLQATGQ